MLINEQQWDQAIEVLTHYRAGYKDSQRNDDVTQKLAVAYQQAGRAGDSAREYEAVATMASVGTDLHREALWNAAELYEKSADTAAARRVWKDFVQRFPQPLAESIEVRLKLADLAREAGDLRDRRDWLQNIIDTDAKAGSQRSERTKTLAARATLELAEPARLAFVAVELKAPLTDSLKLKKEAHGSCTGSIRHSGRIWGVRRHHRVYLSHCRALSAARRQPDGFRTTARVKR